MEQTRFHRVDRTVHDRCDLLTRIPQLVTELNSHPLLDRQVRECLHQPVTQLLRLHWFVAREWLQQGFKVLAGRDAGRRPERVSRATVGDSENPGRGLRVSAEVACLAPYDQERVVDDLFSDIE